MPTRDVKYEYMFFRVNANGQNIKKFTLTREKLQTFLFEKLDL